MQSVTQCPTCATKFKVLPEQLRASEGWVRCGRCNNVFDATDHFVEPVTPGEATAPAPQPSARTAAPTPPATPITPTATEPSASAAPPTMPERPTERWLKDLSETFRPSVEAMGEAGIAVSQSSLSSPDEQGAQTWLNHPDQPAQPESAAPIASEPGAFDADEPAARDLAEQAAPTPRLKPEPALPDADAEPDAPAELAPQASLAVNAALLEAAAAASTFQQEVERWQAEQGHRTSAHPGAEAAPAAVADAAGAPQTAEATAAAVPSGAAASAWLSVSAPVPATDAALNPHAVQAQATQPGAPSPASVAPAKEADVLAGAIVLAPAVHASATPTPDVQPDAQPVAAPPATPPAEPAPNSQPQPSQPQPSQPQPSQPQTAAAPSQAALEEAAAREEADEALRSQYHAQFSQTQELNFVRQAARDAFWRHPAVKAALALLALALALALAAQYAFYNRDSLAAYSPQMKTRMQAFCRLAGCQIAPLRALPALEIEGSTFQGHGDGAFTLFWSVRNRSAQSVQTPDLLLSLRDDAGQTRIRRVFPAAQLPSTPLEMAPGEQWQGTLHLRLADHAEAVTGYQLQIFYDNP